MNPSIDATTPSRRLLVVLAALAAVTLGAATPTHASDPPDPGRWEPTHATPVPLEYFQGLSADRDGSLYFTGIYTGVYRARPIANPAPEYPTLTNGVSDPLYRPAWLTAETGRNDDVIPPAVTAAEGYEHIGDPAWAPTHPEDDPLTAELLGDAGRLLLPLECWAVRRDLDEKVCPDDGRRVVEDVFPEDDQIPDQPLPSSGAIGVVDAKTLLWQYHVELDGAALRKAMWAALSPNGKLLWTQGGPGVPGRDLLAFPVSGIVEENASGPGVERPPLEPKVRLAGAVPTDAEGKPMGITGATFFAGRLFVATQGPADSEDGSSLLRLWSLDVDACTLVSACDRRLEYVVRLVGESEGLTTTCAFGGVLHWLVAPYNDERKMPTFWSLPYLHVGQSTVLTFRPTDGEGVRRVCRG